MGFIHIVFLAIIQGLTEFIPVSSSAHLVILPQIFYSVSQSIGIDIAVHMGSLFAVIHIFWNDLKRLFSGMFDVILLKKHDIRSNIFLLTSVATVPIVVITILLFAFNLTSLLRNIYVISIASIFFSIPLFLADKNSSKARKIEDLTYSDAISIGLWQCFAVIPGASRAGCCITGALIRGYTRMDSTHISFLFAIPTILGSSILLFLELLLLPTSQVFQQNLKDIIYCVILSYLSAFLAIKLFFRYIEKISLLPFVIYRILFGSIILITAIFSSL